MTGKEAVQQERFPKISANHNNLRPPQSNSLSSFFAESKMHHPFAFSRFPKFDYWLSGLKPAFGVFALWFNLDVVNLQNDLF